MVGVLVLLSAFQFIDRRFHRHHRIFELINPNFALKVTNKNKIIILNISLRLFSRSAKHFLFFGFWKRITTILLKFAFPYFLKTQRNKSKNRKFGFFCIQTFYVWKTEKLSKENENRNEKSIFLLFLFVCVHFIFALFLCCFKMIFKVNNFLSFNLSETMIKKMENE